MNRTETLHGLRQSPKVDVCVLGGGINGLSVFRELALQGVNVLLVEKADYCSGASAALSRMVHGGLRYLENGEFSLVKESLVERDRLLRNAPHYVAPLPTTVPIFDTFSGLANASRRSACVGDQRVHHGVSFGLLLAAFEDDRIFWSQFVRLTNSFAFSLSPPSTGCPQAMRA